MENELDLVERRFVVEFKTFVPKDGSVGMVSTPAGSLLVMRRDGMDAIGLDAYHATVTEIRELAGTPLRSVR